MRRHRQFDRANVAVTAGCLVLALLVLGAIGESGRRRAKAVVCRANLGQWGALFEAYTNDHDGHFNPGWAIGETELWMNALRPYYGDRRSLLLCPTARRLAWSSPRIGTFAAWIRTTGIAEGDRQDFVGSYGINSWTNDTTEGKWANTSLRFWGTIRGVEERDRIPVLADALWHDAWPQHKDAPPAFPPGSEGISMATISEITHFCIDRHSGAVNMLFADWSVRPVGLKELWTLKWGRTFDPEGPWTKTGGVLPSDWPEWMRDYRDY